jgi:uncharacterized membrane protein
VTPSRVWALAAQTTGGYRRAWARERLRDSFWPVPALLLAVGVALAAVTANAGTLGIPAVLREGPRVGPGETSSVLGIIASSTLTFLGVVFTLTLVALQLASSQLSPRVVRMFVRSAVTKLAFGILLAAFSYSVAFLVLEGGDHTADSNGLAVAMALVTASLVVFLGYVATTMRLLQVAWVITRVADETRAAISQHIPAADSYLAATGPALTARPVPVTLAEDRRKPFGVLQGVDHRRLVLLAQQHDCVLQLLVRVGEYVPTGGRVIAIHGGAGYGGAGHSGAGHSGAGHGAGPGHHKILAGLNLGRTRTVYQDPSFGLRQLVDIAIQALSPAVNQPTTAVQVIDRLEDLMLRIGRQADQTGCYADKGGRVRFVEPVLAWEDLLNLAFSEITSYGAGSVQVSRRLLAAYDALEAAVPAARRPGIAARRAELLQESADQGVSQAGLQPDALGLG